MPDWTDFLRRRLELPKMKGHRDERMIRELADHLEDIHRDALANGATEAEAEAVVLDWLGDPERAAAELKTAEPARVRALLARWTERREDGLRKKGGLWTSAADRVRDLRMALRTLARQPLFTGVVVLVLALGIGATTSIFTLLDAIILSPLPFDDADRLVNLSHTAPGIGVQNAGQCLAWHLTYEDEAEVFTDVGMFTGGSATITGQGEPESLPSMRVTSGVFRALRMRPVLGRIFLPEEEDPESPSVVLLGYGYWQSRFGGTLDVVGQTIRANDQVFEIIGVMPAGIRTIGFDPSLIFPLQYDRSTLFVGNIGFGSVARLKDGVTIEQAHADAARILPLAVEKFPGGPVAELNEQAQFAPIIQPLKTRLVGSVANLLWIIMAGVGVVLLIACANVANLYLVRADGKQTEMAVRSAMGASRRRIGWEYLKESLLLGVLGGAAGLALAYVGLEFLVAAGPANLPRMDEVALNRNVLFFTLAVSLGAGVFFGIIPALKHGRGGLVNALKQGGRGGTVGKERNRVRNALAVSQMALALVLLVASGLMLRSVISLRNVDPGFHNPETVVTFRLFLSGNEVAQNEDVATTYEAIAHRLEQIPGVTSVALGTSLPMAGGNNVNPLYIEGLEYTGGNPASIRRHKWVGGDFLETLEIPLLLGRTLTWQDVHERAPAVLVSERLAREYWGSPQAALDKGLAIRPDPPRWYKVVGVVADVRDDGLGANPPQMVYWPHVTLAVWEGNAEDRVMVWRGAGFAVRSPRVGTTGFLDEIRAAVWDVNPNLPVRNIQALDELTAQSISRTSFTLVLLCIAAGVALVLGLIGVYGVISYGVSQRRSELGMRMALGARAEDVTGMVLRQGLLLSVVGLGVGMALALGLTRLMAGILFGISPRDPITFAMVPLVLLVVALVASYLPARRAAQVDPMVALRAE